MHRSLNIRVADYDGNVVFCENILVASYANEIFDADRVRAKLETNNRLRPFLPELYQYRF